MPRLAVLPAAALAAAFFMSPAEARLQQQALAILCGPPDLAPRIFARQGYVAQQAALTSDEKVIFQMWVKTTSEWVLLFTEPGVKSCVVANGKNYTPGSPSQKGEPS